MIRTHKDTDIVAGDKRVRRCTCARMKAGVAKRAEAGGMLGKGGSERGRTLHVSTGVSPPSLCKCVCTCVYAATRTVQNLPNGPGERYRGASIGIMARLI